MHRRSRVDYLVDDQGCWIWQLSRNSKGYGVKWDREERRLKLAHRWYYERAHGPIPAEWQVDHRCNVRACVRPAHLEAVSPEAHAQRTAAHRPRKPPRIREQPKIRQVDRSEQRRKERRNEERQRRNGTPPDPGRRNVSR